MNRTVASIFLAFAAGVALVFAHSQSDLAVC